MHALKYNKSLALKLLIYRAQIVHFYVDLKPAFSYRKLLAFKVSVVMDLKIL